MAYNEVKHRNKIKYFYRVKTIRVGNKFKKERIYLGKNLSEMERLIRSDKADKILNETKIFTNLKRIKRPILKILKKRKIKNAGIFGSYAIGENKNSSDIDILVTPNKKMGFEFIGLEMELSEELGKKIDLISYDSLNPLIKDRILKQEIKIL